jgi:lipopolysaccharide/colanic/teichoic acid biosynthesis glycosyltransferase
MFTGNSYRAKRALDVSVLFITHAALAPLVLLVWIVVPLAIFLQDGGPVLYRQRRVGWKGRPFVAIKFRTMVRDADQVGNPWTRINDPRITRFGRILRKTALDELPQVINIARGEMSLVGPRALEFREHSMLAANIHGFDRRQAALPGLTGLAQICDRSDDAHEKLRYDLIYVEGMNVLLDVRILLLSVLNTLTGKWDRREGKH